jgi:Protein of unknown function (DUF992)
MNSRLGQALRLASVKRYGRELSMPAKSNGDLAMIGRTLALTLAGTACALAFSGAALATPSGVKVGTLTCDVSSGWGFVFGSSKELNCTFNPTGRNPEHYSGSISKFGLDVGYSAGGVVVWEVVAPTTELKAGDLAGDYGGATADVAAGLGAGANILVGGLRDSLDLQPLSIEGYTGLNIAAGIADISLKYVS